MLTLHTHPASERPRERCLESGPHCLSLRECLALIIGAGPPEIGCLGLASQIINRPGEGLSKAEEERAFFMAMEVSPTAFLKGFSGLGPARQAKILAAFELGRRYALFRNREETSQEQDCSLPQLAQAVLTKISPQERTQPQEWLGFVPVYRDGKLGEFCLVEKGSRTHVNIDPIELFARLLALRPHGFFLFHNHPSGVLKPSTQDLDITEKIHELSHQLGIQFLGHWIVASQGQRWIPAGHRSTREK
jgi:DNA repair protein RadC